MPNTVTETLAEIERRLAAWEEMDKAATKGPWVYDERGGCCAVYPASRREDTPGLHWDDERNIAYSNSGALFNGNYWNMDDGPRCNLRLIASSRALVTAALPYFREQWTSLKAEHDARRDIMGDEWTEQDDEAFEFRATALLAAIPDPKEQ